MPILRRSGSEGKVVRSSRDKNRFRCGIYCCPQKKDTATEPANLCHKKATIEIFLRLSKHLGKGVPEVSMVFREQNSVKGNQRSGTVSFLSAQTFV